MTTLFQAPNELNIKELEASNLISTILRSRNDDDPILSNNQLRLAVYALRGIRISSIRMRKIIHYLRINQKVPGLVANSRGYYKTTDISELDRYIESLSQRIESIESVRSSLQDYRTFLSKNQPSKDQV